MNILLSEINAARFFLNQYMHTCHRGGGMVELLQLKKKGISSDFK